MLKKLLKYDMRAIVGVWRLLAIGVLGISVVGALIMRYAIGEFMSGSYTVLPVLAMLFSMLTIIAVISSVGVTEIFVHYRFYKNCFSDEGYLTFTLPAKRRDILLAKSLNCIIWPTLHTALIVVCFFIYLLIVPPNATALEHTLAYFTSTLKLIFGEVGGGWVIVSAIIGIAYTLVTTAFNAALINLCITIGSIIAKKQKLLASIAIYFVVTGGVFAVIETVLAIVTMLAAEGMALIMFSLPPVAYMIVTNLFSLLGIVATAILTLILYFVTLDRIEKRLNLA